MTSTLHVGAAVGEPADLPASSAVVIIGAGLAGAALAVELSLRRVACAIIDRDIELAPTPVKAMYLNYRTLEHFRRRGIAATLRQAATAPLAWQRDLVIASTLSGREFGQFDPFGLSSIDIGRGRGRNRATGDATGHGARAPTECPGQGRNPGARLGM